MTMSKFLKWPFAKLRRILVAAAAIGICTLVGFLLLARGSPEEEARSYYERGVKFAEQHDNVKAAIELRNALHVKNDMLLAWRRLAQVEEAMHRWGGVIQSLQSILSLDPGDTDTRAKLAKLLALSGRVNQALELTSTGNEDDRRSARILGVRAGILYKINDKVGAVRQAQQALAIDPANADAIVVLATDRMARGDLKGALQSLSGDASRNTTDLGVQLLKLSLYEQLEEPQQVESLLLKLIKLHPDQIAFRRRLVKFYIDHHRENDAEKEMRATAAANSNNAEGELDLIRFLYATKGPEAAKQELVTRINSGGDVFPYQLAMADLDLARGNVADAELLIQDLVKHASTTKQVTAAQVKLAEIYLKRNKIDAAESLVSGILRKDSHDIDGLKLRASIRITRGQPEAAVADLQQALSGQPRSPEIMQLLGLAYERSGSIGLAEKQYADAARISGNNPSAGINYANFLLRRGNLDRAAKFLVELSRRSPTSQDVLSALAQVELRLQDWAGAQATAEAIRKAGDPHDIADQVLGAALMGQHKYDESIAAFQSAVNASPSAVRPMVSLVTAYVRAQKGDKALAFLRAVLQANPNNAEALVLMGSVQLASGAPDQAVQSFKSAIERQPKIVVGYQAFANFYVGEKKYDQALVVIKSGLEMLPDNIILQLSLGNVLELAQQYEAAITTYERILEKQPGSVVATNNLASLLSEHRKDEASLDRAQSLAETLQGTQVPQFKDTLGWINYRRGNYSTSVLLLEKAAAALPNEALVHYHLAMGYLAVQQPAKASDQLKLASSLAVDSELQQKIHQALNSLPSNTKVN
jgi:cellulose synthase operon protein C